MSSTNTIPSTMPVQVTDSVIEEAPAGETVIAEANSAGVEFNKEQQKQRAHLKRGGRSGITAEFGRPVIIDGQENDLVKEILAQQEPPPAVAAAVRLILLHFCLALRIRVFTRQTRSETVKSPSGGSWQRTTTRQAACEQVMQASGLIERQISPGQSPEPAHQVPPTVSEILNWLSHRGENFSLIARYWLHEKEERVLRRL